MSDEKLKVTVRPGGRVRHPTPGRMHPLEDGVETEVPNTEYWRRRIKAGDVILSTNDQSDTSKGRKAKGE